VATSKPGQKSDCYPEDLELTTDSKWRSIYIPTPCLLTTTYAMFTIHKPSAL